MMNSIFILFCFSLKLILSKNLNENNFFFQLKNTEDGERLKQCIFELVSADNITKEEKTEYIVCILEEIRDNSTIARNIVKNVLIFKDLFLKEFLINSDIEYLCDLLNEILGNNHPFIDDLFDAIDNHKELMNYLIFFVIIKKMISKNLNKKEI